MSTVSCDAAYRQRLSEGRALLFRIHGCLGSPPRRRPASAAQSQEAFCCVCALQNFRHFLQTSRTAKVSGAREASCEASDEELFDKGRESRLLLSGLLHKQLCLLAFKSLGSPSLFSAVRPGLLRKAGKEERRTFRAAFR